MIEFNLEGVDLSSEGAAAEIISRVGAHVLGLKNNRDKFKGELDTAKLEYESFRVAAETEKHDAAKALAEKSGSIEDYKIALQNERDAIINLNATFEQEKNERLLESAVNDFSTVLADDPAGRMYMQSQFNGLVEVKDGVVVSRDTTKTVDEVRQSLVADKANARYIKASVGSGAGSAGSESSGGAAGTGGNKPFKDKTMAEKVAYLETKN